MAAVHAAIFAWLDANRTAPPTAITGALAAELAVSISSIAGETARNSEMASLIEAILSMAEVNAMAVASAVHLRVVEEPLDEADRLESKR
jgi:hypothetical protein